nr:TonB-dependent receptor plug domain-containing protein [uncultured Campylobacter sp.]
MKISFIVCAFLSLCAGAANAADSVKLDAVEVTNSAGESISDSGISERFLQKDALFGPLMDKKIKDIPLQINTVTGELAQNLGASGLENVWRTVPSATVSYMGSGSVTRPGTRGMYGGVIGNNYWDGFMVTATAAVPMMIFEKLEVQNGLSGSLYGSQHPSGIFNYTRKRPVSNQTIVRTDWSEKSNFGLMLDTLDRFEKVGYRGFFILTTAKAS